MSGETDMHEKQPLIHEQHVYKRRWWITSVFCVAAIVQSMIWNTWGPVAEASEHVFGWSDGTVASIPNVSNVFYLVLVLPFSSFMDAKGLKWSMRIAASLLVIGSGLRCISLNPSIATPTTYLCAGLQGTAAIIPFSGPPLVSAIWYPPEERPTATAVMSFFNYFGMAVSFILGPQLVPGPAYIEQNRTEPDNLTMSEDSNSTTNTEITNMVDIRAGLLNLMYSHFALTVFTFILVFAYFPNKPPLPPSKTASIKRTDYKKAFGQIIRNGPLWLVMVASSIPLGVVDTWVAIYDLLVKPLGVSQVDAGWMGFLHSLIGTFSGIFIAKFSDFFSRRRKIFLIILFICGAITITWFALLSSRVIAFSMTSLYVSCILTGIFLNGPSPLFYEISVEASYPVAEGVTGGLYTMVHVIFGMIFLSLASIPTDDTTWLNWVLLASVCVSIPMLAVFPERYKRTDIDLQYQIENETVIAENNSEKYDNSFQNK